MNVYKDQVDLVRLMKERRIKLLEHQTEWELQEYQAKGGKVT